MKNERIDANRRKMAISSAAGRCNPVAGNDDDDKDETEEDEGIEETSRRDDDGILDALPSALVTASK